MVPLFIHSCRSKTRSVTDGTDATVPPAPPVPIEAPPAKPRRTRKPAKPKGAKRPGRPQDESKWVAARGRGKLYERLAFSTSLPRNAVAEIEAAIAHADLIGQPLNAFLTVRPIDIDAVRPTKRSAFFAEERRQLAGWFAYRKIPLTVAWVLESEPGTGANQHLHMLAHVPKNHQKAFDRFALKRYGAKVIEKDGHREWRHRASFDVQLDVNTDRRLGDDGREESLPDYLTKGRAAPMPGTAAFLTERWRDCGPVLGVRWGVSESLTMDGIAEWKDANRGSSAWIETPNEARISRPRPKRGAPSVVVQRRPDVLDREGTISQRAKAAAAANHRERVASSRAAPR